MTEQAKKSHKRQGIPWNQRRAQERQEYFYLVYEQMGVNRTLKRLWGLLRGVRVKISLKRLEEYSAGYGWQARILERAARHEASDFQDIQNQVDDMNNKHAQVFQDLGALAKAGISFYQAKLDAQATAGMNPSLQMDVADLVRLAESAQRGERLARGLATSKAEVIIEVLPPLVKDIFAVFLAVNVITNDPPELVRRRQSEFITRGDQVLQTYYGQSKQLAEKGA